MKRLGSIGGWLLIVFGALFGLQGLGVIGGSSMSGKTSWAVIGPVLAVVGIVLVLASRRRSRHQT